MLLVMITYILFEQINQHCRSELDVTNYNVPEAVHMLNITAFGGNSRIDGTFYDENVTWFDAVYKCSYLGYDTLENARKGWKRWDTIYQMWRSYNYVVPMNVWIGAFRIYPGNSSWYEGNETCKKYSSAHQIQYPGNTTGQCLSARIKNFNTSPTMEATDCLTKLPYICHRWHSYVQSFQIINFTVESLPSWVHQNVSVSKSPQLCSNQCSSNSQCISYEYNPINQSCNVMYTSKFYGYATYTVVRSDVKIIHVFLKGQHYTESKDSSVQNLPDNGYSFSMCNLTFIPSGYCFGTCECPKESNQICDNCTTANSTIGVDNHVIPPKSTSKSRRRYKSETDDRMYAKIVGTVAVLIIFIPFGLTVFIDRDAISKLFQTTKTIK